MKGRPSPPPPVLWCVWVRKTLRSPWTLAVRAAESEAHARERLDRLTGGKGFVEAVIRRADQGAPQ
jgi:hypothetical protein